ncbi:hypothetical protein ACLB2K_026480 [Fragaria x ananassa]
MEPEKSRNPDVSPCLSEVGPDVGPGASATDTGTGPGASATGAVPGVSTTEDDSGTVETPNRADKLPSRAVRIETQGPLVVQSELPNTQSSPRVEQIVADTPGDAEFVDTMDSNYTAKLMHSGEGASVSFDHSVSYIDFANSVRDRFPILGRSIVNLRYNIFPDVVSYRLENEDDMKIMFRVLARYSSDFVDVDVCSFDVSASGYESVLSNNVNEDSSVSFDENDYLGCYKPEEAKRYCSKG